jgi:hypothetical protein
LGLRNAYTIAQEPSFNGKLIWVKAIDATVLGNWKRFITEYEQACRSMSLVDRTLFCIELVGDVALDPPPEDLCLARHALKSYVDDLDMLLYTSILYRNHRIPDLYRHVCISVVAKIAAYDPVVADHLEEDQFLRHGDPKPTLLAIGKQRGWNLDVASEEKDFWWKGMLDLVSGEGKIHSAVLALKNNDHEIRRRIWSGQVGVLLPFVEERRRDVVNGIAKLLKVPYTTRDGFVITDVNRLEINHVLHQIGTNGLRIPSSLHRFISSLTRIRNSLSHFEPCDPNLLKSQEITNFRLFCRDFEL